jgi:hypothetical protein
MNIHSCLVPWWTKTSSCLGMAMVVWCKAKGAEPIQPLLNFPHVLCCSSGVHIIIYICPDHGYGTTVFTFPLFDVLHSIGSLTTHWHSSTAAIRNKALACNFHDLSLTLTYNSLEVSIEHCWFTLQGLWLSLISIAVTVYLRLGNL